MSILCDTCGKPAKSHYCWFQDGSNSKFHPSEKREQASSETRLRAGLRELADSVKELIDWMPTCSVGSSGYMRRMAVKEKLAALLSLEGDKRTEQKS